MCGIDKSCACACSKEKKSLKEKVLIKMLEQYTNKKVLLEEFDFEPRRVNRDEKIPLSTKLNYFIEQGDNTINIESFILDAVEKSIEISKKAFLETLTEQQQLEFSENKEIQKALNEAIFNEIQEAFDYSLERTKEETK